MRLHIKQVLNDLGFTSEKLQKTFVRLLLVAGCFEPAQLTQDLMGTPLSRKTSKEFADKITSRFASTFSHDDMAEALLTKSPDNMDAWKKYTTIRWLRIISNRLFSLENTLTPESYLENDADTENKEMLHPDYNAVESKHTFEKLPNTTLPLPAWLHEHRNLVAKLTKLIAAQMAGSSGNNINELKPLSDDLLIQSLQALNKIIQTKLSAYHVDILATDSIKDLQAQAAELQEKYGYISLPEEPSTHSYKRTIVITCAMAATVGASIAGLFAGKVIKREGEKVIEAIGKIITPSI